MQKDLIEVLQSFLKKVILEKGDGTWIDILATITKQYNIRIHPFTKLKPILAFFKKNEEYVCHTFLDKRKNKKPKFQVSDLVRAADLRKTFSKGDTTIWSYNLYKTAEIVNDTIPSYKIDNLPERYNEVLLKKTEVTKKKEQRCYESFKLQLS